MKFELNDRPAALPMLLYGIQWLVVAIPSIVILGVVVSRIHFPDPADQIFYMQKLFGLMGAAMIVQIVWGHRLPLVIGPASVLLIGVVASLSGGIPAIYTAIFTCGVILSVLAYSGALSKIQGIFTPRIVTVILCLIAFTLSPVILRMVFSGEGSALFSVFFTIGLVLAMLGANRILRGIWKSVVVLFGLVGGSAVYGVLQGYPVAEVPLTAAASGFFIPLEFDIAVILAFLFCFIALLVNELGSIQAVGGMLKPGDMQRRTNRGVGIVGLTNIAAGALGVVGPVDYSMSPGVISATGCASRYPLIVAGIGLAVCAFFPHFIWILSGIPGVVMGSILLYLMASQLSAGLQMLIRENAVQDFNDGITVALPLMVALLLAFAPESVIGQIPALIRPIVGNGFVMGVIVVLLLEHLILKRPGKA